MVLVTASLSPGNVTMIEIVEMGQMKVMPRVKVSNQSGLWVKGQLLGVKGQ